MTENANQYYIFLALIPYVNVLNKLLGILY